MIATEEIEPSNVFSPQELSTIQTAFNDDEIEGSFIKGRHGVTRYILNESSSSSDKMIVMIHGIGGNVKMYKEFAVNVAKDGYSVLRYDLLGHGYSKYINENDENDIWVKNDPDMLVDQLEDLLCLITEKCQKKVIGIVGLSLGGIVTICAQHRWNCQNREGGEGRFDIPNTILVNPSLWAQKPFMARVADKIPSALTFVMKNVPASRVIIGDSYMEATDIAFGRDPSDNQVIAKDAEKKKKDEDKRVFGKVDGVKAHPFLAAGILGANSNSIRDDLLPTHVAKLKELLQEYKGSDTKKVSFLYGELDATVPFKQNIDTVRQWDKDYDSFNLHIMERIGHEAFCESSDSVSKIVLESALK